MPTHSSARSTTRRVGIVSTYPPKLCGLATFAAALASALRSTGVTVDVVRIDDGDPQPAATAGTVIDLVNGDQRSIRAAAAALTECDVAVIQHEYGIYGGVDGDEVITLMSALDVPTIVVLHTVPLSPTAHQRAVLEVIVDMADGVVVMGEAARLRLATLYATSSATVTTIAHGATNPAPGSRPHPSARAQLLTWGLLGPGKGIEHAIDAMEMLGRMPRRPHYTVAGVTHPKVLAWEGDRYRESLIARASLAGLVGDVTFDDTYRTVADLTHFVATADLVVLPYDSTDQVTSGVLVDAVAAGKPVIATAFPHAVEVLGSGAGVTVPQRDPAALADAIESVLVHPERLRAMAHEARRIAPSLSWVAVAERYLELADQLSGARVLA